MGLSAQTVWNKSNGTLTFTKAANADWKQAANQDRISDSVWITRASSQNLFNIRKDTAYGTNAPNGTLWAFGTTDSFATLTYTNFVPLSGNNPQSLIGKDLVLQLVAEKIYLDVKFTSYASGSGGGGAFEYVRSKRPGTASVPQTVPMAFGMEQNYPNPFNPATVISYQLSASGRTTLTVHDLIGREVAVLVNEMQSAGSYTVHFDGSQLASGTYFVRLTNGGRVEMRKMTLMK